jgi:hypothetical protein
VRQVGVRCLAVSLQRSCAFPTSFPRAVSPFVSLPCPWSGGDRHRRPSRRDEHGEVYVRELLHSLFSAEELSQFLHDFGAESVVKRLPQGGTSATFFFETAQALERRGLIDESFFDALVAERPRRESDIRRVQRRGPRQ